MHEFIPQPRTIYSTVDTSDEEDYDVYLFYPSLNRIGQRARRSLPWDALGDAEDAYSSSDVSTLSSPSYSYNSDFNFPNPADVRGISALGYSPFFRKGLWAQSRRISRRLDAFITRVLAVYRSLRGRFSRRMTHLPV